MNTVKKRKKYTYLLLELLIAIALLSLFLGPMLKAPFGYIVRQKQEILSLRLHLEAEKLFIRLEESLRTGQISWDRIVESGKKKEIPEKANLPVSFGGLDFPKMESSISLTGSTLKRLENGTWVGTVNAKVEFLSLEKTQKFLYCQNRVFFVAKKQLDLSLPPVLNDLKDSICREAG